jgi:hypothetical protein
MPFYGSDAHFREISEKLPAPLDFSKWKLLLIGCLVLSLIGGAWALQSKPTAVIDGRRHHTSHCNRLPIPSPTASAIPQTPGSLGYLPGNTWDWQPNTC